MKTSSFILFLLIPFNILLAQNPPVAVNDTAVTISEETIAINVLLNDYDPDGDQIKIHRVSNPQHGEKFYNDSAIYYTPDASVGTDSLFYTIQEINDPESISDTAWVFITVNENLDLPVASDDEFTVMHRVPTEIDVLGNDWDPQNDSLVICYTEKLGLCKYHSVSNDSLSVVCYSGQPLKCNPVFFRYRVREKNTENQYYSDWAYVTIHIEDNPEMPVAINDTASTTGGIPHDIYAVENDINPDPENFHLAILSARARHGAANINGDHITYTPNYSYSGLDTIRYEVKLAEKPHLFDNGEVFIHVNRNPSRPVAVNDTAYGVCGETLYIDLLQNDYNPENDDEIEIKGFRRMNPDILAFFTNIEDNYLVIKTGIPDTLIINTNRIYVKYRIQKKTNPESYSDWANVTIFMEQNPDYPVLNDDQASIIAGYPAEIDVTANDVINGYQPEFYQNKSIPAHSGKYYFNDDTIYIFISYMTFSDAVKLFYLAADDTLYHIYSYGYVDVSVEPNHSYDSLYINNINAGIHSDGYLFSNIREIYGEGAENYRANFEYPKGSGKNTIFCSSLWIGGIDQNDSLHLAGRRYKSRGYDFQIGPVSDSYEGESFFRKWSRVWKLNKEDIEYHKNNYWHQDYQPIPAIAEWPGNGDVSNGQAEQLAPFFDKDNNSIYEPMRGDYPLIRGDQCILFIYNDDKIHTDTKGKRMKVEIQGMAYAFNEPENEILNNTIFIHYNIYNRSENTYYKTFIGLWSDIDLGYALDDYVGCNVALSSYYGYNGLLFDGSGEPYAYGKNPPAQSVTILAGPYMDSDNLDNPDGECDYSVNGTNFGDGIIDNERLGMTGFMYHNNSANNHGDPEIAPQYYNYLIGKWKDGSPLLFGGTGFLPDQGTVGPECRFMFPGSSDSCNWGTNGKLPNGGYNQNGFYWTEETGNNNYPNYPNDRRGIGTTGPFTFKPGDRQELDLAFSVAVDKNNSQSSLDELFDNLDSLFHMVEDGEILIPDDQLSVNEKYGSRQYLKVYPNPAKEIIYIELESDLNDRTNYVIYNSLGKSIKKGQFSGNGEHAINIQDLKTGFYIIKVNKHKDTYSGRFIKF